MTRGTVVKARTPRQERIKNRVPSRLRQVPCANCGRSVLVDRTAQPETPERISCRKANCRQRLGLDNEQAVAIESDSEASGE